jgi:hypothetical protein
MMIVNADEIVLDGEDTMLLSSLIEWERRFVASLGHITMQCAARFVQDREALNGSAA